MNGVISKVTFCPRESLVTLPSIESDSKIIHEILSAISSAGVNIDMISQTAPRGGTVSLSFTTGDDSIPDLLSAMGLLRSKYPKLVGEISSGNCKLNFYGSEMYCSVGVAADVLSVFSKAGVQILLITTSSNDISVLISPSSVDEVFEIIGDKFALRPSESAL